MSPSKVPMHDGPLTAEEREEFREQARHYVRVSRLKAAFIVFCFLAIVVTFFYNRSEIGGVGDRVTRIESPCQRYGSESKVCQEAFETAVKSINHRIACYIDRKAGKPFKPSCRGVHLRIEEIPELDAESHNAPGHKGGPPGLPDSGIGNGGDAVQTPPQGNQTPAPGNGGKHQGGSGGDGGASNPAPSPVAPTQPSSPQSSGPTSSSNSSSSSGTAPAAPPTSTPSTPPPADPITEGVGNTVDEVGNGVGEVVESVNGIACSATGALGLPCK